MGDRSGALLTIDITGDDTRAWFMGAYDETIIEVFFNRYHMRFFRYFGIRRPGTETLRYTSTHPTEPGRRRGYTIY